MTAKDYLSYIVNEIHCTIVATVDDEGLPVTCAIDMMDADDNSLYFLTAKSELCLHCGNCMSICPADAVIKK